MKATNPFLLKLVFALPVLLAVNTGTADIARPSILLIVADDLNYDSLGSVGGVAPEVTPNLDRLAAEGFSFEKAFTVVSVCQPSRQSMLSGLYPHHYGSAGFFPMREGTPTLPSLLRDAGYLTGNIHKRHHMLPLESFNWTYDNKKLGLTSPDGVVGRDPGAIAGALRRFIKAAETNDQPFFMVVNSADPHRPFHGDPVRRGSSFWGDEDVVLAEPSRVYEPDEVTVPPTLPDLPGIRRDLAKYASSVRRLDDTVGACLKVLEELQKTPSTLVVFVSDNGMPLPFAKFDCYLGSNRSPLFMRWPEVIREPRVDREHLVLLMDLTPTLLELAGLPIPKPMDGQSLVPFLENRRPQAWREAIVFLRNEDIYYGDGIRSGMRHNPNFIADLESQGWVSRPDHPDPGTYSRTKEMRCYYDGRYGYIYNNCYKPDALESSPLGAMVPYPDPALTAMSRASADDSAVRERYQFYLLREREELYDWSRDPGSRQNLARNPEHSAVLRAARTGLLQWMETTGDPLAEHYRALTDDKE
jgi:N-sulfoglucosamine sulfohydrolase